MLHQLFRKLAPALLVAVLVLPATADPNPHSTPKPPAHSSSSSSSVRTGRNNRNQNTVNKKLALTSEQMKRWREAKKAHPSGPERREALKKIMTPEQRAKYDAYLESQRRHQR
jgi:Spy/CpxP family protein refolding chaperone